MTKAASCSALLRAEWIDGVTHRRATAMRLTPSSVFIATEALPPLGQTIDMILSFAGRRSWRLRGCVTHVHLSVEPGSPAGFVTRFDDDPATIAAAQALIRGTTHAPTPRRRATR